jgi:hypothetical protein
VASGKGPLLSIKEYVDGQDLRDVNWQKRTLQAFAKEHNLKPGECVVFENAARNKGRLIANINGLIGLFIPPIDPARQLTVHLEINEFLRALAGTAKMSKRLEERRQDIADRLDRRKRLKERARRRRAKETK